MRGVSRRGSRVGVPRTGLPIVKATPVPLRSGSFDSTQLDNWQALARLPSRAVRHPLTLCIAGFREIAKLRDEDIPGNT